LGSSSISERFEDFFRVTITGKIANAAIAVFGAKTTLNKRPKKLLLL